MGASITPPDQTAMTHPCSDFANDRSRMGMQMGGIGPPNNPCMARQNTTSSRLSANPSIDDATVNPITEQISTRLWPKRMPSHPAVGIAIAVHTRLAVRTQDISSRPAERSPRT